MWFFGDGGGGKYLFLFIAGRIIVMVSYDDFPEVYRWLDAHPFEDVCESESAPTLVGRRL